MNKSLLTLALFSAFPLYASVANTQPEATLTQQPQLYLDQAITLQHTAQVAEGMLAYAEQYATGNAVHAVASATGVTLYSLNGSEYTLQRELSYAELGLDRYNTVTKLIIAPDDKWLLAITYQGTIISIPLNAQNQPVISGISRMTLNNIGALRYADNLLVNLNYNALDTYQVDAESGRVTALHSQTPLPYSIQWALAADVLVTGGSRQNGQSANLIVYRFGQTGWQPVAEHQLSEYDFVDVQYLALSPQGTRVLYGNYDINFILALDKSSNTLTTTATDFQLTNYAMSARTFLDETTLIAIENDRIAKYNTVTKQREMLSTTSYSYVSEQYFHASAAGIRFLINQNIVSLNSTNLQEVARLQPGELDALYQFSDYPRPVQLGNNHLLSVNNSGNFRLFHYNDIGLPQLVQSGSLEQLLGASGFYASVLELDAAQQLYLLFQSDNYAVVRVTSNQTLERIASGSLANYEGNPIAVGPNNAALLDSHLVVASGDTLTVFERNQDNQFQFVSAIKNGISGITGIANIDMVFARNSQLYTINNHQQTISRFNLNDNALQQLAEHDDLDFSNSYTFTLRGDFLTLLAGGLLQVLKFDTQGALTNHTTQNMDFYGENTLNLGERFLVQNNWNALRIYEQDVVSGRWSTSVSLEDYQLQQNYNIESVQLIPAADNVVMYDNVKRQLHTFSYNSAPYVTDATKLALQFNQGQSTTLSLADVIKDEEDVQLTYTLQAATPAFSIADNGTLSFNGEQTSAGEFDVLVQDPAQLASQVRFNYSLNLAPVLKAGAPSLTAEEDKSFYFDLASYFTDPEGMAIRYSLTSSHAGISLTDSGILAGTFADAGEQTLNFTVTDSAGATASYSVPATVAAKPDSGGSMPIWLTVALAGLAYRRRSKH